MLKLNNEEKKLVLDNYDYLNDKGFVSLRGITYYIKLEEAIDVELIVEKAAQLVGINTAHYEIVNINGNYYYLSESLSNKGEIQEAYKVIGFDYDREFSVGSLYYVWNKIQNKFPQKCEYLMKQIVKIFLFDILLMEDDRNNSNWCFISSGEDIDVWIFDNEYSLVTSKDSAQISSLPYYVDDIDAEYVSIYASNIEKNMVNLDYFLNTSSDEFIDLLRSMYAILTPEVIAGIINGIEKENNRINSDKDKYIESYRRNYQEIGNLLNKKRDR